MCIENRVRRGSDGGAAGRPVNAAWLLAALALLGCGPGSEKKDPHVVPNKQDLREDPGFLSPPILQHPIYACTSSVVVKSFVPGAKLEVFVSGTPGPIGSAQSWLSSGQHIIVSAPFTVGQVVTATQSFDGATSAPSNAVTVTSHVEDYPDGVPQPRLHPPPLYECGRAVGIADTIPGAWVKIFTENPAAGGGFDAPAQIGSTVGGAYAIVSPGFVLGARVWAETGICAETGPPSAKETVQSPPAPIPPPTLDPVHEGVNVVTVWGPGGAYNPLVHGATLDVFADSQPPANQRVGGQPTPGGNGQRVGIDPAASAGANFWATQGLCASSGPGPSTTVVPCADLPPAKIRPPLPGDIQIEVTEYVPGARILVYAGTTEIGDAGPTLVNLSRPLVDGETITVVQRIGDCASALVYVIEVDCALGGDDRACSGEWPAFRHNALRNAQQITASDLSDPYKVKTLEVKWQFPAAGNPALGGFRGSPIVHGGRVFAGNRDGRLFALDAATGALLWQYPPAGSPALDSQFHSNPSSFGIAASAAMASIERRDVVILAAPDQSIGANLGSGRLFALDAQTGAEIWKSPEIAVLNGLTASSTSELHEQTGYSSPLVLGNRVYIGIANHGDNPIQNGRVAAVELSTGAPVAGFGFQATGTRGGGVWSSVSGGLSGGALYITTGNTRCWNGGCQDEPKPNHGLSLLRLDPGTGALNWKLQPVPFDLDGDPDWATGAVLMSTACGELVASTMKDGWSYAVQAAATAAPAASVRWQFPATGFPFTAADGTAHGDSRYLIPGAGWKDVFITTTGGEEIVSATGPGFNRLHALNACAGQSGRVRWIADVPGTSAGSPYQLGPPTVTRGIVFVGTAQGHLVAIADPSVWPAPTSRCSNPSVTNADCLANGFALIPRPKILLDLTVQSGAAIQTEPALAGGRVFVSTGGGRVFMLAPN